MSKLLMPIILITLLATSCRTSNESDDSSTKFGYSDIDSQNTYQGKVCQKKEFENFIRIHCPLKKGQICSLKAFNDNRFFIEFLDSKGRKLKSAYYTNSPWSFVDGQEKIAINKDLEDEMDSICAP